MLIFFFFLLPFVVYLLTRRWVSFVRDASPVLVAFLISAISTAAVLVTIVYSGQWTDGTQIVWRGLQTNNAPLVVGGTREEAGIGWPNGAFVPELKAGAENDKSAALRISRSGAFLYDEDLRTYLNGILLKADEPQAIDGCQLIAKYGWFEDELQISTYPTQEPLLNLLLPSREDSRDRVYSISSLLRRKPSQSETEARKLVAVEKWAEGKLLLRAKEGSTRILDDREYSATCTLPCRLTLNWTSQKMPVVLFSENPKSGDLRLIFLPPWRQTSPLPPEREGKRRILLTANPLPDEIVFALPLGYVTGDKKPVLEIAKDLGESIVFIGEGASPGQPPVKEHLPGARPLTIEEKLQTGKNFTSRMVVPLGKFSLLLATVNDLPQPLNIAWRLLLTFSCFAIGIFLVVRPVIGSTKTRHAFFALMLLTCLWNFLLLRFLLALRFATEPNYLDDNTVKGVMVSLVGLTFTTTLAALWLRLRTDLNAESSRKERRRAFWQCLIYWMLSVCIIVINCIMTPNLWTNLPERFRPRWWWALAPALLLTYIIGAAWALYRRRYVGFVGNVQRLLRAPLSFDAIIARSGKSLWNIITYAPPIHLLGYAVFAVLLLLIPFGSRFAPGEVRKLVQGSGILFFFCLVPALFWLAARLRRTADVPHWWRMLTAVVFLGVLPCFVLPVFVLGDTGSVYGTLAIVIPTAVLLLLRKPLVYGSWLVATLLLFIVSGIYFSPLLSHLPGEAGVRLLVFQQEENVPGHLLTADIENLSKLQNAYHHTWETKAIAHTGGWFGVGFGEAPTRLSQIRQDTIQFDSLYSFFIASEYGLLGGCALLLLYALPLFLMLFAGRGSPFNFGVAAAAVICAAFALEAVVHAGMNLGAFPVTGRSMPLITVHSITDLIRWTLLFCFVLQLLSWRTAQVNNESSELRDTKDEPEEEKFDDEDNEWLADDEEVSDDEVEEVEDDDAEEVDFATASTKSTVATVGLFALGIVVLSLVLWVAWNNGRVVVNARYGEPFDWSGVLDRVKNLIADERIVVDENKKLVPRFEGYDVSDGALIRQEMLRFNALPQEEREDGFTTREFQERLGSLSSVTDFNQIMDALRRDLLNRSRLHRPSLFRLMPPERWDNGGRIETRGGFRVASNPSYNMQMTFSGGTEPKDLPQTTFRDGKTKLIGAAWVSGKWTTVVNPNLYVPWVRRLARALQAEWERDHAGAKTPSELYAVLTLDRTLQEAAANFAAKRGRELHLLQFDAGNTPNSSPPPRGTQALPPRVALTAINLPRGETLALGGYPRMTAFNSWRQFEEGEWLPPAEWVEREAPRDLRLLYGGDRNFDLMVVGSATKPLLASAVLAVHPNLNLDKLFAVRGAGNTEADVFGILVVDKTEDAWEVENRPDWINFTQYLAKSDNRYHVRLGFLGLASAANGAIEAESNSNSTKESFDKGKTTWGKTPRFPIVEFSARNRTRITKLGETSLAQRLEKMYLVNAGSKKAGSRFSFWTKNEADDIASLDESSNKLQVSSLFAALSPERTNLRLNELDNPRDYVTILLGGGTNQWANTELAAAFGTCLTGTPVVAHIIKNQVPFQFTPTRENFSQIAPRIRQGLADVVTVGTVAGALKANDANALDYLKSLRGYNTYAKTGTLRTTRDGRYTSRIILAIVQWTDEKQTAIRSGIVFSLVAEQADEGTASRWLGKFILDNKVEVERLLKENQ